MSLMEKFLLKLLKENMNVSIYNVNGQLVSIKEYQSQIDVSELNNGTYFMEVITKDGRGVSKFIKQ